MNCLYSESLASRSVSFFNCSYRYISAMICDSNSNSDVCRLSPAILLANSSEISPSCITVQTVEFEQLNVLPNAGRNQPVTGKIDEGKEAEESTTNVDAAIPG